MTCYGFPAILAPALQRRDFIVGHTGNSVIVIDKSAHTLGCLPKGDGLFGFLKTYSTIWRLRSAPRPCLPVFGQGQHLRYEVCIVSFWHHAPMLFPDYYSIKNNFFQQTIGNISRFQPATCLPFNRQLVDSSTGNLLISSNNIAHLKKNKYREWGCNSQLFWGFESSKMTSKAVLLSMELI